MLRGHRLVVNVAGLFLVTSLLRLALILPLVDDDALNILRIDERLQEPLAVGDGNEPLERLRFAQFLDRFKKQQCPAPPSVQRRGLRLSLVCVVSLPNIRLVERLRLCLWRHRCVALLRGCLLMERLQGPVPLGYRPSRRLMQLLRAAQVELNLRHAVLFISHL